MDPHEWLEDVVGDDALGWVRERNALTVGEYGSSDDFVSLRDDLLAIYDADDRIPVVRARGEKLYNFWRDGEHPRGLWRRTPQYCYWHNYDPIKIPQLGLSTRASNHSIRPHCHRHRLNTVPPMRRIN